MEAYDGDATKMAALWIDQSNAKGGLLGRKLRAVYADTKSDRVEGTRAGQEMVQQGAKIVLATADYDYGAPAALQAQKAGVISVFLGASDPKAGVVGVGPYSFTAEKAGQLEGATVADWGYQKKGYRTAYVLLDDAIEYDKSVCAGFDLATPLLLILAVAAVTFIGALGGDQVEASLTEMLIRMVVGGLGRMQGAAGQSGVAPFPVPDIRVNARQCSKRKLHGRSPTRRRTAVRRRELSRVLSIADTAVCSTAREAAPHKNRPQIMRLMPSSA
jgi:branched-chain amino acid transport system substrate-binding protein